MALYKRGNAYVLHRVIRVNPDHYLIRGDNTYLIETVPDSSVIGVLSSFLRKGKRHDVTEPGYQLYARFWHTIYPLRIFYFRSRRFASRIARKLGILPQIKRILG